MSNQQLADYVKQCRQAGMPDNQIKEALLKTGWSEQDVNEALSLKGVGAGLAVPAPGGADSPDEQAYIHKWSWGGFVFPWVYYLANRLVLKGLLYLLGAMVPGLNIVLQIITGIKGRKVVWESGKWTDLESYKKRQKLIDVIGIVILVIAVILIPLIILDIMRNKIFFSS